MSLWMRGCAAIALIGMPLLGCSPVEQAEPCAGARCGLPPASLCGHDGECASGVCADGLCCDRSCDGPCEACDQLHAVGRCLPAPTVAEAPQCAAGAVCGSEGSCAAGVRWGVTLGSAGMQQISAIGGDGQRLLIAGIYAGELAGMGPPVSGKGAFVAELDGEGLLLWRRLLPEGVTPRALAVTADGAVLMGGSFYGTAALGRTPLLADGLDGIVLRLENSGALGWVRLLGGPKNQQVLSLAATSAGEVAVAGDNSGTLQLGAAGELGPAHGGDAFVALLDGEGEPIWGRGFGSAGTDIARSVVTSDQDDALLVGGVHNGPMQLGGHTLGHVQADDAFVARFSGAGEVQWARSFGGTGADGVGALALDPAGDLVVAGMFTKGIDFGGHPMVSLGCEDVFIAKLGLDGTHRWSVRFGDDQAQLAEQVALDSSGRIFVSGMLLGGADLGWGVAQAGGHGDVHIAAFSPEGAPLWIRTLGDDKRQRPHGLAVSGAQLVVGGYLEGALGIGEQLLQSTGGADGFVTALSL